MNVEQLKDFIENERIPKSFTVEQLFEKLLISKVIDFSKLSIIYVRHLEMIEKIHRFVIAESTINTHQMMLPRMRDNKDAINRALYTLDTCGSIPVDDLKEKYGYDKEKAEAEVIRRYGVLFDTL